MSTFNQTSSQQQVSSSRNEEQLEEEDIRWQPKLAFANERTFLAWVHFTVLLGGIAIGVLNFHTKNEESGSSPSAVTASLLSFLAIAILLYAVVAHNRRASTIRRGELIESVYMDRLGPTFVLIAFLAVFAVNIILRHGEFDPD